jgi:hypothetical protein
VVTPTANTTYTVIGTGTNSCNGSSTIFINVNPTPTVNATGPVSVCRSDSLCLGASGALSYVWTGPCGFTGNQANVCTIGLPGCGCPFYVVGTDANGCTGQDSVCVIINPLPVITVSSTDSMLCSNFAQTATLTASGALSYTWSTGANSSSVAVTPSTTTSYTVTGTNSSGCMSSASITQSASICGGLYDVEQVSNTKIFPNPTKNILNLKFSSREDIELQLIDLLGKVILREKFRSDEHSIKMEVYPDGVYFIKIIHSNDRLEIFKIIKE